MVESDTYMIVSRVDTNTHTHTHTHRHTHTHIHTHTHTHTHIHKLHCIVNSMTTTRGVLTLFERKTKKKVRISKRQPDSQTDCSTGRLADRLSD